MPGTNVDFPEIEIVQRGMCWRWWLRQRIDVSVFLSLLIIVVDNWPPSAASEFAGGFRAYQFMRLCSPRFFRSDVSEMLASSVPELVLDHSSSDIHHPPTKWRDTHFVSTPSTSLRLSVYTTLTSSLFLTSPRSRQHGHRC